MRCTTSDGPSPSDRYPTGRGNALRTAPPAAAGNDLVTEKREMAADLGNYDLVGAMREPGCPLCRVLAEAEVRAMDAFVEQAGRLQETFSSFCDRGGFCREHAWLFHRRAALSLTGVPVAQMYEALVRRDIEHLERLEFAVGKGRRPGTLLDRRTCLPCERGQARLRAKTESLLRALEDAKLQGTYQASDGLCVRHLDLVGAEALREKREVATFLIRDLRRRLERLERRLADYERSRDYRFADDPVDADAWTDVVRSYVGDQYAPG